jgi:hypothetical protein
MLKNWITYYIFLLASLAFALLYPGRTSSAFFYALLLLPPVSLALFALMLHGFKYTQTVDRLTAAKGETVQYRLTVRNRSLLLLPWVEVTFHGSDAVYRKEFSAARLTVPPRGSRDIGIEIPCKYKGVCDIGIKQVKLRDLLGFFTFRQEIGKLGTLVIYPRIVPLESFPVAMGYDGDARASDRRSRDNAETISEIRKYVSGDRLRSIHWKLSAKREELMVKNFEQTSGAVAELILDASCEGRGGEDALILEDKLVECAVSLAYHFASLSIPTTLHYRADAFVKNKLSGMGDFQLAYRMLSETQFGGVPPLKDAANLAMSDGVGRKTVVIIASSLNEGLYGDALKLKASGCMACIVAVEDGKGCGPKGAAVSGELRKVLADDGIALYVVGIGGDLGRALTEKAV